MTTYSQYDYTSNIATSDAQLTFISYGLAQDAIRYKSSPDLNIAFEINTNAPGPVHVWRDDGGGYPMTFSHSASGPWTSSVADAATIYMSSDSSGNNVKSFQSPQFQYSSASSSGGGGGSSSFTTSKKVFCNFW